MPSHEKPSPANAAPERPSDLDIRPPFDLEFFLAASGERRLGGAVVERLLALWREWMPSLHVSLLKAGGKSFLLVWLDEAVEWAVDEAWQRAPSQGLERNTLAQCLCMGAVQEALPEIAAVGCAPAPRPFPELGAALEAAGLSWMGGTGMDKGPGLSRRFAVLTYFPFRGGCEVCALRRNCPRGSGMADQTLVLPGHEQ